MGTAIDSTKVQHVNKKSSDELLKKFAEVGSDAGERKDRRLLTRRRRIKGLRDLGSGRRGKSSPSSGHGSSLVERKRLLPPAVTRREAVLRRLGIGKSQLGAAAGIRNKSLMGTIGKTWRRTVEGASRVIVEKHYNKHRRLISDAPV